MKKHFIFFILMTLAIVSCKNDDDVIIENEEELITTLNFKLVSQSKTDMVTMTYSDRDGEGGNKPKISGGTLKANTTYSATVEVLNESESPAEDITKEVKEEGDEHQFFYSASGIDLSFTYQDKDSNNRPIGIITEVSTKGTGSGHITITLKHKPNKSATTDGNIKNSGGETDIEVQFPVVVN